MELNPFLIGCGAFMIGFGLGIVIMLYYRNRVRIERIVKEEEDLSKEEQ